MRILLPESLSLQVASLGRKWKWKGKEKEGEREIEMMRSDLEEYMEQKGLHELKEETGGWKGKARMSQIIDCHT